MMKKNIISEEKRNQLWLSDLCVKYGELSVTPSASSLSSSCYSESENDLASEASEDTWNETEDTASSYEYYWSKSNTGSIKSGSDGHDADESSEGEDVPESKTPVALVYSFNDNSSPAKSISPPKKQHDQPANKNSVIDLAAPFGDPLQKWQDSKANLLIFGPSTYGKKAFDQDDAQSVSTVSGSGMDFFRKFVQRKGPKVADSASHEQDCKECENQFRREILIDRLVSDALSQAKKSSSSRSSTKNSSSWHHTSDSSTFVGECSITDEKIAEENPETAVRRALESSCSSGKCLAHQQACLDETGSLSSFVSGSTVSGTGLLFLRNYLKKKKGPSADCTLTADDNDASESATLLNSTHHPVFNTVPIPFPPKNDFYGPAIYIPDDIAFSSSERGSTRRSSVGSTIADLLNDNFDSEDSELRNLDWEEWDDEGQQTDLEELIESDDASIVVDILDMAKPVIDEASRGQSAASVVSFESASSLSATSEPTFEDVIAEIDHAKSKKKGFSIPFLDLPSPPSSSSSSGSVTPTLEATSVRSLLSTPRQDSDQSNASSPYSISKTFSLDSCSQSSAFKSNNNEPFGSNACAEAAPPKKRLAEFWERRVSGSFENSINPSFSNNKLALNNSADSLSKFKPALPSYYDPEGNKKANEKIQKFLDATRKAADDSTSVSIWSSNYEKLKRGELSLDN